MRPHTQHVAAGDARTSAPVRNGAHAGSGAVSDRTFTSVLAQLRTLEHAGGGGLLDAGAASMWLSDLDRVVFPATGQTKGDLLRYYASVAGVLVPALARRPVELVPMPGTPPAAMSTEPVDVDSLPGLLEVIERGAVTLRPWCARQPALDSPDYVILTVLAPAEGAAPHRRAAEAARWIHEELTSLGLHGVPLTGGRATMHVMLPMPPGTHESAARLVGELVASRVVARHPGAVVMNGMPDAGNAAPDDDHVRLRVVPNAHGRAAIAPYSLAPGEGESIVTPLDWPEVTDSLDPGVLTVATVPARLAARGDLWGAALARGNSLRRIVRPAPPRPRAPGRAGGTR